jgi:hypothetical protein
MSAGGGRALACGDWLIRRACRHLLEDGREREAEWLGELPVILADPAVRFGWVRVARMLLFAGGAAKVAHRMPKTAEGRRFRVELEVVLRASAGRHRIAEVVISRAYAVISAVMSLAISGAVYWMTGQFPNELVAVLAAGLGTAVAVMAARTTIGIRRRRRERAR